MVEAGQMALIFAAVVSGYVAVASFLGVSRRVPELVASARYGLYTVPALLLIATAALIYAFVNNDFSVRYVVENSSLAMPDAYTWVALYAGNAGSLLFLAIVFSTLCVAAVLTMRHRLPHTAPYTTGIMALVLTFFLGVMLSMANPLERLAVAVRRVVPGVRAMLWKEGEKLSFFESSDSQHGVYLQVLANRSGALRVEEHLPDFVGVRDVAGGFTWVAYETGERELYDLSLDPHQLDNRADDRAYRKERVRLEARTRELLAGYAR